MGSCCCPRLDARRPCAPCLGVRVPRNRARARCRSRRPSDLGIPSVFFLLILTAPPRPPSMRPLHGHPSASEPQPCTLPLSLRPGPEHSCYVCFPGAPAAACILRPSAPQSRRPPCTAAARRAPQLPNTLLQWSSARRLICAEPGDPAWQTRPDYSDRTRTPDAQRQDWSAQGGCDQRRCERRKRDRGSSRRRHPKQRSHPRKGRKRGRGSSRRRHPKQPATLGREGEGAGAPLDAGTPSSAACARCRSRCALGLSTPATFVFRGLLLLPASCAPQRPSRADPLAQQLLDARRSCRTRSCNGPLPAG